MSHRQRASTAVPFFGHGFKQWPRSFLELATSHRMTLLYTMRSTFPLLRHEASAQVASHVSVPEEHEERAF